MMEKIRIGDVCTVVSGSTPKTNVPEYWDGDIDWITPAELEENTFVVNESIRKITRLAVEKTGLKPFPKGTVILSSRAPIGKVAIAGKEMFCNQGFKNIICSQSIYNEYLFWFLKGNTEYLNSLGRGATFKEISKGIVEDIRIALPSIDEQRYIADVLKTCWETKIMQGRLLEELDTLIKSRFVEMFGDTVTNPMGWEKAALGEVCDVRDGTHDSPKFYNAGYPLVTSKNLTAGKIDLSDCSLISESDYEKINMRSKVDNGDILMPMIGTVGKPVIVDIDADFAIKNVALIKFCDDTRVSNIYVKNLLESDYFDNAVMSRIRGGTQKFLALGDIRKLEVLIPDMKTQQEFADFVQEIDKLKVAVQKSLGETQLLFDSLMQKYFG